MVERGSDVVEVDERNGKSRGDIWTPEPKNRTLKKQIIIFVVIYPGEVNFYTVTSSYTHLTEL